ncbi:hypothetical protein HDU80_005994 [Chytriomyces hyalinus]|nr:hypothetical protein HDU80_005994 [Chytriomyces hyalinus]
MATATATTATATAQSKSTAAPKANACSPSYTAACSEWAKYDNLTLVEGLRSLPLPEQCIKAFTHAQKFYPDPKSSNVFDTHFEWNHAFAERLKPVLQNLADCNARTNSDSFRTCENPIGKHFYYSQAQWMSHEFNNFSNCVDVYKYWVVQEAELYAGATTNSERSQDDFKTIVGFSNAYTQLACAVVTVPSTVFACAYAVSEFNVPEYPPPPPASMWNFSTVFALCTGIFVVLGCFVFLYRRRQRIRLIFETVASLDLKGTAKPSSDENAGDTSSTQVLSTQPTVSSALPRNETIKSSYLDIYHDSSVQEGSSIVLNNEIRNTVLKRESTFASNSSSDHVAVKSSASVSSSRMNVSAPSGLTPPVLSVPLELVAFGNAMLPRDCYKWTVDHVLTWIEKNDLASGEVLVLIREQKINGNVLLHLSPADYETGLQMKTLGERVTLEVAVNGLRAHCEGADLTTLGPPQYEESAQ